MQDLAEKALLPKLDSYNKKINSRTNGIVMLHHHIFVQITAINSEVSQRIVLKHLAEKVRPKAVL